MLRCPYCGHNNRVGVRFCEKCRADLRGVQPTPTPSSPASLDPHATVLGDDAAVPVAEAPAVKPDPNLPSTVHLKHVPLVEVTNLEPSDPVPGAVPPSVPADPPPTPVVPPALVPKPTSAISAPTNPGKRQPDPPTRLGRRLPPATTQTPLSPHAQTQLTPHAQTQLGPPSAGLPTQSVQETRPKLVVIRGLKLNVIYPIYEGRNFIGRPDERPVDIDLVDQESPDRVWASRQHAVVTYENGVLTIEDLNSLNGTFVNRARITPGQQRVLQVNDVIQIGTVHLKVTM
jgi:hypothetical protein